MSQVSEAICLKNLRWVVTAMRKYVNDTKGFLAIEKKKLNHNVKWPNPWMVSLLISSIKILIDGHREHIFMKNSRKL